MGSRYQGAAVSSPPAKLGAPRQSPSTCLIKVYSNPSIICGAQNRAFRIRYGGLPPSPAATDVPGETAAPWRGQSPFVAVNSQKATHLCQGSGAATPNAFVSRRRKRRFLWRVDLNLRSLGCLLFKVRLEPLRHLPLATCLVLGILRPSIFAPDITGRVRVQVQRSHSLPPDHPSSPSAISSAQEF